MVDKKIYIYGVYIDEYSHYLNTKAIEISLKKKKSDKLTNRTVLCSSVVSFSLNAPNLVFIFVIETIWEIWNKKKQKRVPVLITQIPKKLSVQEQLVLLLLILVLLAFLRKLAQIISDKNLFNTPPIIVLNENDKKSPNNPVPVFIPKKRKNLVFAKFNHFIDVNNYVLLCKNEKKWQAGQIGQIVKITSINSGFIDFDTEQHECQFDVNEVIKNSKAKVLLIMPWMIKNKVK